GRGCVPSVGGDDRRAGGSAVWSRGPGSRGGARRCRGAWGTARTHRQARVGGNGVSTLTQTRMGLSSADVRQLREQYVPRGLHVGAPVVVGNAAVGEVL